MNPKERVKELIRENSNVNSIAELERTINVSNGTINKWDRKAPSLPSIEKVADYFETSVDYLIGRTDIRSLSPNTSSDLDAILDDMKSFNGKQMTAHDREVIRAYLEGKFADK